MKSQAIQSEHRKEMAISSSASMANKSHAASRSSGRDQVAVVMVPLPAQGHLNQLLNLSRLISAYNIPVHFVGAATHNRQAKLRVHGWDLNQLANIHFHDFSIPPFPSPSPSPTASDKFPSHLIPSFRASSLHLRGPLAQFLRSLSSKTRRLVVVHDSLMASAVQGVDSISNIELYNFHSVSAFAVALYSLERNKGIVASESAYESIQRDLNIPSLEGCFPQEFLDFIDSQFQLPNIDSGKIYNTCKVIERPYLEVLQSVNREMKHWALGPFNPVKKLGRPFFHSCLEWLDRQEPKSVIYVSFGTTTAMEDRQIREIAIGLDRSKQKFIWVLRDADKGDVFDERVRKSELPEGFEKMVAERGLVVRDWAPQLEILSHPATGGFLSHCGWNSCMESITMGVPVAAWPMHSDQPRNTVLMTELLGVGLVVKHWDRRDELVPSTAVENAVRTLMVSKQGDEIRKKAEELGDAVRRSVDDGGVSRMELDSFIAHITR